VGQLHPDNRAAAVTVVSWRYLRQATDVIDGPMIPPTLLNLGTTFDRRRIQTHLVGNADQ